MYYRVILQAAIVLLLLSAVNCATIAARGGAPYKVTVKSDVPETQVSMIRLPAPGSTEDPQVLVKKQTPAVFGYDPMDPRNTAYFKCEAPGYKPAEIWLEAEANLWFFASCLFFPIGPVIDGYTKSTAVIKDYQDEYYCQMEKE